MLPVFLFNSKYKFYIKIKCLAPAPSPSRYFLGPANEVKERLHCQDLQRLSGLTKALAHFIC